MEHSLCSQRAHTVIGRSNLNVNALSTGTISDINNKVGGSLNVRDLAMKLNSKVEKKNNFRPAWLKSKKSNEHNSTTCTTNKATTAAAHPEKDKNNRSRFELDQLDRSDLKCDRETNPNMEKQTPKLSPTTTAMHEISTPPPKALTALPKEPPSKKERTPKRGVLDKAHFWRTQTVQRTSPLRERLATSLVKSSSSKEEKEGSPSKQQYSPTEERTSLKSLGRRKGKKGDHLQVAKDRAGSDKGEMPIKKALFESPTKVKKEEFVSSLRVTPKKLIFKRDEHVKDASAKTEKIEDGVGNDAEESMRQPLSQKATVFSTPLRNQTVKSLGERFGGGALVHHDKEVRNVTNGMDTCIIDGNHHSMMDESRDAVRDEDLHTQNPGLTMVKKDSNGKESFQSKIAKFSQVNSMSGTSFTNVASFPNKLDIKAAEGITGAEGPGQKARSKELDSSTKHENVEQVHKVSNDRGEDNEEGRKEQHSSHFWKNQIKNRRSTKKSSCEKNEMTRNPPTLRKKQLEASQRVSSDETKGELILGRTTFAEILEETQSPAKNYGSDTSPDQQRLEGDVSQKFHYWIKQQESKESTISRGRNHDPSSKSRNLSRRRSSVNQSLGDLTSQQTTNNPSNVFLSKRNPVLSPAKAKELDTIPIKNVQKNANGSMNTLFVGEAGIDEHDYLQYMGRDRSSRSKKDQSKAHSSFISIEDSMDVEENEDFRNLIKSSMSKNAVGKKSVRKWPPSPQNETERDMGGAQKSEEVKTLDEGANVDIPPSTPARSSAVETTARSPLKSRRTPGHTYVTSSIGKDNGKTKERLGAKKNERIVLLSANSSLTGILQNGASRIQMEKREANIDVSRPVGQLSAYASEHAQHALCRRRVNTSSTKEDKVLTEDSCGSLKPRWTPKHSDSSSSTKKEMIKTEENLNAKKNDSGVPKANTFIETCSPLKTKWTPRHSDAMISTIKEVKAETKLGATENETKSNCASRDGSCPVGHSSAYASEYTQHAVRNRPKKMISTVNDDHASGKNTEVTPKDKIASRSRFSWPPSDSLKIQEITPATPTTPMRVEKSRLITEVSTPGTPIVATTSRNQAANVPLVTPIRHNRSSENSPSSPRKEMNLEVACENSVITDASSFVCIREVKKRLWDEGENLKMWQKEEAQRSTPKIANKDDKQVSHFKSRFYRAAEVAQNNCKENITTSSNPQSLSKPDTVQPFDLSKEKERIQEKAKEKAVAHLLAKLSSVRRSDPDEALRVIDSILEKHGERNAEDKNANPEINTSAESQILPEESFEEKNQSVREDDEDDSADDSESDDSTVSELTNPTYMSGFGDCSPRSRKRQFGNLVSKDGRLKPAHHSTRPSSFLIKDRSHSQRKPSDLPPRLPQHPGSVSRNVKPLTGSQRMAKSRINRKAIPPPQPLSNALPKPKGTNHMHSKDPFEGKATPRSTNVKSIQPKSPVKTLSAGGSSMNNRGLLYKLKDWGSDSDEKEDFGKLHEQQQNPNSPGERLKKLGDVAQKLKNDTSSQQSPIRNKERRFLYPKRDPPPRETRIQTVNASKTARIADNDAAWDSTESANYFRGEILDSEKKQTRKEAYQGTAADEIFDPFVEPSRGNDTFANEVLAEKFYRMEKAYHQ